MYPTWNGKAVLPFSISSERQVRDKQADLNSSKFFLPKQYQTIFWGLSLWQYNSKQYKMARIKINNNKQWPIKSACLNAKIQYHPIIYSSEPKTEQ